MSTAAPKLQTIFGDNVRAARLAKGWTQAELAERSGRRQGELCDLENGRHAPTLETVSAIAKALGIAAKKLL